MTAASDFTATAAVVAEVLAAFGVGPASEVQPLGGTAARKWNVLTPQGRFVVRRRPDEFADLNSAGFEHAILQRLDAAGFPVPCPLADYNRLRAFAREGGTYEILRWIAGDPFPAGDAQAIAELGGFLARFHRTVVDDLPADKSARLREDHPDLLEPYLAALQELACDADERQQLTAIGTQLDLVRRELDAGLYASLPQGVIHGDFHPGNVRFRGPKVAALYDFDYLDVQAQVRDVSDAMMFFASRRRQSLNPDDIRSLTQPFMPDAPQCRQLLRAYQAVRRFDETEWEALGWLIRSRWLQMRLRGSRKVAPAERVCFVLEGFFEVIDWLDIQGNGFFQHLRRGST